MRGRFGSIVMGIAALAGVWPAVAAWNHRQHALRAQQALAALERGDLETVSAGIAVLSGVSGFESHVRLLWGGLFLDAGDYEAALREIVAVQPSGALRHTALRIGGECLYQLGRLPEAERLFRQLAAERPGDLHARRWLGAIAYDLGNVAEALAQLEDVAKASPADPAPHRLIGRIHWDSLHDYAAAVPHYRRALAAQPAASIREDILRELAQSLIALGEHREALAVLSEAERDALALALEAECHWALGAADSARAALAAARARDPAERAVLMLQSRMHLEEGRPEPAIASLQERLRTDPHDFPCRYQLALAYQRVGQTAAAEAELARMHQAKAFRDELSELFLQARRLDDAATRERIAELCRQAGRRDLAEVWEQSAAASRRAGPALQLGPEWFSSGALPRDALLLDEER